MCCHFVGLHFWLEKNSFVQKKSSCDDFLQNRRDSIQRISKRNQAVTAFSKPSRLDESLHWNPFTFGIESRRFWKSRHGLISFWNSLTEWNPGFFWSSADAYIFGTSHSADHDCDTVQGKLHLLISFVPLKLHLFCEFLRPLVSEFDGGSEFLTGNWIWECIFINLINTRISHAQVL